MSHLPYRLNVLSLRRTHGPFQTALVAVELLEVRNLLSGFSPQQLTTAYNFTPTVTVNGQVYAADGAGQTIAIVDAYAFVNPTLIDRELAKFDQFYGLPAPPSFTKLNLETTPPGTNADTAGWAGEMALDVEWAHAIAPKANLLLVGANSDSDTDLFAAVDAARNVAGVSVVSMSWGFYEAPGLKSHDAVLQSPKTGPNAGTGVTFVASSGDDGGLYGPLYPASSPNVVSVGGTALVLRPNSTIKSETAWSFNAFLYYYYGDGGSTGGYSKLYAEPAFQKADGFKDVRNARTVPDVAYVGDPFTGVGVIDSVNGPADQPIAVGGTSAGAPQWAALFAIANEIRAGLGKGTLDGPGQTLPALYSLPRSGAASAFHDIIGGSNARFRAVAGYDLVTGLGSPIASMVIAGLAKYNGTSSPSSVGGGVSAGGSGRTHEVRVSTDQGAALVPDSLTAAKLSATDLARGTALTIIPVVAPQPVVAAIPSLAQPVAVPIVTTPASLRFDVGTTATGAAPFVQPEILPVLGSVTEVNPVPAPVPAEAAAVQPPPAIPDAQDDLFETPFDVDFDALPLFAGDVPAATVAEEGDEPYAIEAGLVAAALILGGAVNLTPADGQLERRRRFEFAEVN